MVGYEAEDGSAPDRPALDAVSPLRPLAPATVSARAALNQRRQATVQEALASGTATQQAAIEVLRLDLVKRTHTAVSTEYGQTDCGQSWAALCVDRLPEGFQGTPGALVFILVGAGVSGPAAVMAADGSPLADGIEFSQAVKATRSAGAREFRALRKAAYH